MGYALYELVCVRMNRVICNAVRVLEGGRTSVEESVSLGRVLRDLQGHAVPRAACGATERARDRRVQGVFTLGRETSQSAQSRNDAG